MDAKDNGACGFFVSDFPPHCSSKQCPEKRTGEKMKRLNSGNLLLLAVQLLTYLWKASSINVRTCEGYPGQGDLYHSGFHCPRLSDAPEHMYCCWPGNGTLKYCCSQEEYETLMKVNLSELLTTYIHRINKNIFYNMLSHTWIGKHLVRSLFHSNAQGSIRHSNKGVRIEAKERLAEDVSCDNQRPLEDRV
ncbi:hypothetical protein XENTR_v10009275 [Xenopus tropicalis]|nr:hypothetical protein XENTR_v10009275 [Xenopus tropicalis]